jgi:hypothetical protein
VTTTQLRLVRLATLLLHTVALISVTPPGARAQSDRPSLLQIEVGDSIGLPLPDAKMEVFTLLDGGIFYEWTPVQPYQLPKGVQLLRFSHPGYKSSTFSVPLREGSKVAVRVRLAPERDSVVRRRDGMIDAYQVNAIALALEGRSKTDVLGRRRILDNLNEIPEGSNSRLGDLLRRSRGTDLRIRSGGGGTYLASGEASNCPVDVMLNGDRRHIIPFATFDQMYNTDNLEVIEVFPRGGMSIPLSYQVSRGQCGLLIVWYRK